MNQRVNGFDCPLVLGKILQDVVKGLCSTLVLSEPQDLFSTTSTRGSAAIAISGRGAPNNSL
jgi:hypothetical protein